MHLMCGFEGHSKASRSYSKCNGKSLECFKQESNTCFVKKKKSLLCGAWMQIQSGDGEVSREAVTVVAQVSDGGLD